MPVYYNHHPHVGWYIDSSSEPLFPFGFGLSYTSYEYKNLTVGPATATPDDTVNVSVEVTNTGDRAGEEIVQLYVADVVSSVTTPVKELKGFSRVALAKGQTKEVDFCLASEQLSLLNRELEPVVEPGEFLAMVGPVAMESFEEIAVSGGAETFTSFPAAGTHRPYSSTPVSRPGTSASSEPTVEQSRMWAFTASGGKHPAIPVTRYGPPGPVARS